MKAMLKSHFGPAQQSLLEPQASIHGQAYYLEDNFVITHTGTELLTPGMPYTADEVEAVMREQARK